MAFWNIGSGEEDYIAYVGDAVSDVTGPCSDGMFAFAYSGEGQQPAQERSVTIGLAWDARVAGSSDVAETEQRNGVGSGRHLVADYGSDGVPAFLDTGGSSSEARAAEIAKYPGSGGTYIVTRSSFIGPDGRVLLIYNIWFQNDMLDFIGLRAWRELRKQVVVAVEPERVAETQARYDRLMCSLAEGMAQGDVRSDFAQALEESREAAKQEARDLATGYVLGKIQKLQRAGKVFSFADSIWDNIPSAARAKGEEWFRQFGEKVIASRVRQIGPFTEFSVDVAGRVPGSFTRWVKVVDEYGRTIRVYHDTFDKTGRFIHRSIKFPGPERHVQ